MNVVELRLYDLQFIESDQSEYREEESRDSLWQAENQILMRAGTMFDLLCFVVYFVPIAENSACTCTCTLLQKGNYRFVLQIINLLLEESGNKMFKYYNR